MRLWRTMEALAAANDVIRCAEAGTQFLKYSVKNIYHDGDVMAEVVELYARKYV